MGPCYPKQLADPKFTAEEVAAIWAHAKRNYIDHDVKFDETIMGTATDLGLRPEWVAKAFTMPKGARAITNEMYRKMSLRNDAVRQAKMVVRSIGTPGYARLAAKLWSLPRTILTTGHYAVFPITHAGDLVFRPTAWRTYFKGVFDAYKFASRASHEAAMQQLVREPNYTIARRGGLINAPESDPQGILSSMSGPSRRGFDALKITRQLLFDKEWNRLAPEDKTLDTSKHLSEMINHATGAYTGRVPFSKLQFAPQLTASRWARAIGDPIKTAQTFANWKNATAGERIVAQRRVMHAAEFVTTYAGLLAINQGLNQVLGSKDKVNMTDPRKSDWLQFKIAGHVVGVGSGVREAYSLLGALVAYGQSSRKELHGKTSTEAAVTKIGRYAANKLEPTSGAVLEGLMREDKMSGRPLPWSNQPGSAKRPRMGTAEYLTTHYVPIPLTGGVREAYDSMRQRRLSAPDTIAVLKAARSFVIEATGLRFSPSQPEKP